MLNIYLFILFFFLLVGNDDARHVDVCLSVEVGGEADSAVGVGSEERPTQRVGEAGMERQVQVGGSDNLVVIVENLQSCGHLLQFFGGEYVVQRHGELLTGSQVRGADGLLELLVL